MKKIILLLLSIVTINAFSQSVTVLPQDGSYSQNVAPQGAFRYQRQFYLITSAEMLKAGFTNGMAINSIGFTNGVAQDSTIKGSFKVYLQNSANTVSRTDTNWTVVSSATNSYHLTGLTPGIYDWQLQSVCSAASIDTSGASFSTSNLSACNPPTNFTTTAITTSSATFNWTPPASSGITKYVVQFTRTDSINWISDTITLTTKNLTGLLAGKNYQWRVKTICASSFSDFATTSFTTEPIVAACNVPTGLSTSAITNTSTTISWTAASGASYYGIQHRRTGTYTWTNNIAVTPSFNITGLKSGTAYEWKVRTVCGAGNGAYVSGTSFTTTGAATCYAPLGLSADSLTDSTAVLTWISTGATSYSIRYRLKDFITWSNAVTPMTLVHNDSITIPNTVGSYDVPFTGGSAFAYTGGGVYVAYEYADSSGTLASIANTALCTTQNTVLKGSSGQDSLRFILSHSANKQDTLPGILKATNLRPETRFGSPGMADSVAVSNVYALGYNAIPYGNPSAISALIKNYSNSSHTYSVTLVIKDQASNTIRYNPAAQNVTVNANSSNTISFAGWSPTLSEKDSIIVSIPAESGENFIANNKNYYLQNNNSYVLAYDDGSAPITSAGFDTLGGLLLTRHTMNGCGRINGARIYLSPSAKNHAVRAVVLNAAGAIVDSSADYTADSTQTDRYHSFYFPNTPLFSSADFYVGLAQARDSVNGYFPLGVQWEGTDVRNNAYYRSALSGGVPTDNPSPGRLMIRAEIVPAIPALTISGSTSLCPAGTNVLTATTTSARFANNVIGVSSQASNAEFSSTQALGTPDVYPQYSFNSSNWVSGTPDGQREYIALGFSSPDSINYIDIYETYNPGSVDTVYVKNPGTGNYDMVYGTNLADSAITAPQVARIKRITFPLTAYNVSEIRIAINSPKVSGYNAIDAVAIGAINDPSYVAAASYSWTGGATTQSLSVTTSGTYTVTVTDADNCPKTASVTVTDYVAVNPTISANRATTFCVGDTSVILTSSQLTGNLWSTGATTRSITVSTSGNYTVSYNDGSGCGVTTSAITVVTVNPLPVVTVTGNLLFCPGSSTSLNAGGVYANYLWSTAATTQIINVSSAGTYSVTVTDGNLCKGKRTVSVSLSSLPNPIITGTLSFCPGSSTTLNAGAFTGYNWSTGATSQTINVSTAATFTVTVTNSNNCTRSTSVTTSLRTPPSPFIVGNLKFCPGDSTTITANLGYSQYNWSTSATTRALNVNSAGTFTVTVTDGNGCTASTNTVTQLFAPAVPIITGNTSICPSTSTILDAGTGFSTFLWSTGSSAHSISVSTAGTFTVAVTDSNNCAGSGSVTTTINNTISDSVGPINGQTFGLCNAPTKIYSVAPVNNATFYQWTVPAQDSIISGQGTTSINVYFRSFTSDIISIVALNACGQSPVRTLEINGAPFTPSVISGPNVACKQSGRVYSIPAVAGATTYTWTVPIGATITSGQGTTSVNVNFGNSFLTAGNICVTASNPCGISPSRCFALAAVPPMPASITGPSTACKKQANVLYSATPSSGATSYDWTVPAGAKVNSGQGTTAINATFGNPSGNVAIRAVNACGNSLYKTLAVTINCREEGGLNVSGKLNAYPNPTSGYIDITFETSAKEKYLLKVFDIIGNIVITETGYAEEGNNLRKLDLSKVAKGMYFLRMEKEGEIKATMRIVVE